MGKCKCFLLSILWLIGLILFLVCGFFASFNHVYDNILKDTDMVKDNMQGIVEDVPVPTTAQVSAASAAGQDNLVGVAPDGIEVPDMLPKFVLDNCLQCEVEITWAEPIWFGLVTKEEKEDHSCGEIDANAAQPCRSDTMEYSAGGPTTSTTKVLKWDIKPGVWFVSGGAPANGGDDDGQIDCSWKLIPAVKKPMQIGCSLGCVVLGLLLLLPCIRCCCCKKSKRSGGIALSGADVVAVESRPASMA
jgi:hypothetical protein